MTESIRTLTAGCHCGGIRFSVTIDTSNPKASKCNCSICLKSGRVSISADKDTDFKLLLPSSLDEVPKYRFGAQRQSHCFCQVCGVHCFAYGSFEWEGQLVHLFSFNALTLDPDQGLDLRELKFSYWDGKLDKYAEGPSEKPPAGGIF